nr:MAG TPA: hypothetical protein [Caudoviricetes sp.]
MIARLSLEVFYIITRKLVGAFYVFRRKRTCCRVRCFRNMNSGEVLWPLHPVQ